MTVTYLQYIRDVIRSPRAGFILLRVYLGYFLEIPSKPSRFYEGNFNPNKSFVRFGDGEILAYLGLSFEFEVGSLKLARAMEWVIKNPDDRIVYGLPFRFLLNPERDTSHLQCWLLSRYVMPRIFAHDRLYADAFYFRDQGSIQNLGELYAGKKIYAVGSSAMLDVIKNNPLMNLDIVGECLIPERGAFEQYVVIKEKVVRDITRMSVSPDDLRILVSAGPTAKILIYELSCEFGWVCHDVGAALILLR